MCRQRSRFVACESLSMRGDPSTRLRSFGGRISSPSPDTPRWIEAPLATGCSCQSLSSLGCMASISSSAPWLRCAARRDRRFPAPFPGPGRGFRAGLARPRQSWRVVLSPYACEKCWGERACSVLGHVLSLVAYPLSLLLLFLRPQPSRIGSIVIARIGLHNQVRRSLAMPTLPQAWLLALGACLLSGLGVRSSGDKTGWEQTTYRSASSASRRGNGNPSPGPASNSGASLGHTMMPSATGTGWQT